MDRLRAVLLPLSLAIPLVLAGCARVPVGDAPFTVAASWPEAERTELERAFAVWLKAEGRGAGPVRIDWVPFAPGDDLTRLVQAPRKPFDWRSRPLDVVLGGPVTDYVRLERLGRLVAVDRPGRPLWCAVAKAATATVGDDPRHDPDALAWAKHVLDGATWESGYAALVNGGFTGVTVSHGIEGVAIVIGGDNPTTAQRFLKFLAERDKAGPPPAAPDDPDADALLADLLGATLTDASDELRVARKALRSVNKPTNAAYWMIQPPPWPPASVSELLTRDKSGGLLETLAAQMAPDADVRGWLVRSWLGPPRQVDGPFLAELARAANGKLVREPRFRAWLRGEWTAWARQRYRRVVRLATSDQGARP